MILLFHLFLKIADIINLKITKNIKDAILRKATTQELKDVAKKDNFRTMQDMGKELLLTGDLSFAEYQRILTMD